MTLRIGWVVGFLLAVSLVQLTVAQTSAQTFAQAAASPAASALPRLVRFGGTARDINGSPLTGVVGITFALYSEQTGGAALWLETQNVTADSTGHYTALLGATKPDGLPAELFTSEAAHWVGVQISGQAEQPRVLLVSAPYALKAGDAETIGGLPPSAFVLATPATNNSTTNGLAASADANASPATAADVTTTGGTLNYLPIFNGTATVIDSDVFQTGAGVTAKLGINTTTPATTLDLNGSGTVRGTLSLPATAPATATAGKTSQPLSLAASAFSSTSGTALNQTFHLQAEPAANDTTAPSGTLNLLFGEGANAPTETGLKISSTGIFTFAAGQTFPGTGDGTVSSVATGLGLKGGPITKTGTLTIDTTIVPQLGAPNTFTDSQSIDGGLTATGTVKAATLNATNASISNSLAINSANGGPLSVTSSVAGAEAIYGYVSAGTGEGNGVYGLVNSSDPAAYGVYGYADSSTGSPVGVYGQALSNDGIGLFGQNGISESATGSSLIGGGVLLPISGAGVWGDGGTAGSGSVSSGPYVDTIGVLGTTDHSVAGLFVNNSFYYETVVIAAENATGYPLVVTNSSTGQSCSVDYNANLSCDGTTNTVVAAGGAQRKVALSAIESPQNWFEDAGAAELVNGKAVVMLDPEFIPTVNTEMDYKVFPVPNGDCKGLYVTNKTPTSFEVRELGGGTSSIRFDYRIMALRKKYENVRFAEQINPDPMKMLQDVRAAGATNRQSHTPVKKPTLARPPIQTTAVK